MWSFTNVFRNNMCRQSNLLPLFLFFFASEKFIFVFLLQVSQPYVILQKVVGFPLSGLLHTSTWHLDIRQSKAWPRAENQVGTSIY